MQFVGLGEEDDDEYILFDLDALAPILREEIAISDFEELLKNMDLRPLFGKFYIQSFKDWGRVIPYSNYLVFDYDAWVDHTPDGDEWDSSVDLVGYLNEDMNFVGI